MDFSNFAGPLIYARVSSSGKNCPFYWIYIFSNYSPKKLVKMLKDLNFTIVSLLD